MGNTVKTVFLLGLLSGLLLVIGELLGGQSGLLIATIILAPLSAMWIQAAISRSREFAADRGIPFNQVRHNATPTQKRKDKG